MTKRRIGPEERNQILWAVIVTTTVVLIFIFMILMPTPNYAL